MTAAAATGQVKVGGEAGEKVVFPLTAEDAVEELWLDMEFDEDAVRGEKQPARRDVVGCYPLRGPDGDGNGVGGDFRSACAIRDLGHFGCVVKRRRPNTQVNDQ